MEKRERQHPPAALPATAFPPPSLDPPKRTPRNSWAAQLERVYGVGALGCPSCGARLRLVAVITRAPIIQKILDHLRTHPRTANPRHRTEPARVVDRELHGQL